MQGHDEHSHGDGHGHHHDRGWRGAWRYIKHGRRMWASDVNEAVLDLVAPKPGEHVIDIGAGMGPGAVIAARRGAKVTAVDPTPFMRRVMRMRRLLQRARSSIVVVDGAAEHIPLADSTVDAAWSVNAMHHWTDPERAAAELNRVLRSGGRVVLVDEDFDDPRHGEYEAMQERHDHHDHDMHMVDIDRFGELLGEAGFGDVIAEKRDIGGEPCRVVTATKP